MAYFKIMPFFYDDFVRSVVLRLRDKRHRTAYACN